MNRWKLALVVVGLVLIIALTGIPTVPTVEAGTRSDVLWRGTGNAWPLGPGDQVLAYYRPDGRPAVLSWRQAPVSWLLGWSPSLFLTVSFQDRTGWRYLWAETVAPWSTSRALGLTQGRYRFEIWAYTKPGLWGGRDSQSAVVSLKID